MDASVTAKPSPSPGRHSDCVALVLQGGGALGAYQAGVYEELAGTAHEPDWIVGVSIGAINAALIAGNAPENRVKRLAEFWHLVSSGMPTEFMANPAAQAALKLVQPRSALNQLSALWAAVAGIPGFFQQRVPPAWLRADGAPEALSVYDTSPLRATLERLVDFDLINSRKARLSVGAVNVRSGNSQYFDNFDGVVIGPEHIMASGAMPPAFAPVTIDGEAYWDGGIVSNTPLQYVLDMRGKDSLLVFQIDLFSARGKLPANLAGVQQRQKEILYSSRTRFNSNMAAEIVNERKVMHDVLAKLPKELQDSPAVRHLRESLSTAPTDIVHLIYRKAAYELESMDYEFSRASVLEHWQAGQCDMRDTTAHPEWLKSTGIDAGVTQFDLTRHSRPV
ncbi:MAG TPA: patatin-like phospholipase family protein [Burkholderiales bacterium]|nr:patatin-like phospholipase family protein [Burkholderiales bacterium]